MEPQDAVDKFGAQGQEGGQGSACRTDDARFSEASPAEFKLKTDPDSDNQAPTRMVMVWMISSSGCWVGTFSSLQHQRCQRRAQFLHPSSNWLIATPLSYETLSACSNLVS